MSDEFYGESMIRWSGLAQNWFDSEPPAVPSSGDLDLFREMAGQPMAVVVLGSTPQLRNLSDELVGAGSPVFVVDFSEPFFRLASEFVRNPKREQFLNVPWLETGLPDHCADLVLGDKVYDNVRMTDWRAFTLEMARILAPGGRFVHHVGLSPIYEREFLPAEALASLSQEVVASKPLHGFTPVPVPREHPDQGK